MYNTKNDLKVQKDFDGFEELKKELQGIRNEIKELKENFQEFKEYQRSYNETILNRINSNHAFSLVIAYKQNLVTKEDLTYHLNSINRTMEGVESRIKILHF